MKNLKINKIRIYDQKKKKLSNKVNPLSSVVLLSKNLRQMNIRCMKMNKMII